MGIAMPEGSGLPMIGMEVVVRLLPLWATIFFLAMLLCGLMSTLDSGMCAASSLWAIDMANLSDDQRSVLTNERLGHALSPEQKTLQHELNALILRRGRQGMLFISLCGLLLAILVQYVFTLDRLWWVFNGVATCFVIPTLLSLYDHRLSAKGLITSICAASVGLIAFVYGNYIQDDSITVGSAIFIVGISFLCCRLFRRSTPWQPEAV